MRMKIGWLLFALTCSSGLALAQETKDQPATKPAVVTPASAPAATPAAAAATAAPATPQVPGEPQTAAQVVESAKQGIAFAQAKNWWGFSSIIILVGVFLFKLLRDKFFPSMSKRWIYIIVPGLGVIAMLLAAFAGGVSWGAAWLVLTSAPCAALFSDLVKRGILGKEPSN